MLGRRLVTALFDTNVLLAALRPDHADHRRCRPWLDRVRSGAVVGVLSAHSLAELYVNLTRVPVPRPLSPPDALTLIRAEVSPHFRLVPLDGADYEAAIADLAGRGIAGAALYDGIIAAAARKAGADRLLTLNLRDFTRVWPGPPGVVAAP